MQIVKVQCFVPFTACPGLSGNTSCFGNGQCNDLDKGNGTCLCNVSLNLIQCYYSPSSLETLKP